MFFHADRSIPISSKDGNATEFQTCLFDTVILSGIALIRFGIEIGDRLHW
jgi:hypothetical protein